MKPAEAEAQRHTVQGLSTEARQTPDGSSQKFQNWKDCILATKADGRFREHSKWFERPFSLPPKFLNIKAE